MTDGTIVSSMDAVSAATGDPHSTKDGQTDRVVVFKSLFASGFQ